MKRICINSDCNWTGEEEDCLDFKHAVGERFCPKCHEVTEELPLHKEGEMKKMVCTKSERQIKSTLRGLRKLVETDSDPTVTRLAYTVEQAMRWMIEPTVKWETPDLYVIGAADSLRKELKVTP